MFSSAPRDSTRGAAAAANSRRVTFAKQVTLLTLVLASMSAGCSFALIERPPARDEWPAEASYRSARSCTESWLLPIIDGAIVSAAVGDSIYASKTNSEGDIWIVPQTIVALAYAASAIYGFVQTGRCSEYRVGPPYRSASIR